MAKFGIGETHYDGEKRVEVAIQCRDEPDGPCFMKAKSRMRARSCEDSSKAMRWR